MNSEAKVKFKEVQKLFNRMSHELICVIVESYYIWRTLTFARSIPEVGKEEAEKVARQMSLYKEFLIPTEQSHLNMFIIGLMKFFDKNTRALSFANLIKQIKDNESTFTPDVLKSVHPHLEQLRVGVENYLPITEKDLEHFEALREKHKDLISNLKDIRDKQFAHTDMEVINKTFVPNQIEELIKDIQEMFNKLSNTFDRSATTWDHLGQDSIRSTKFLLENLERGEKVRLEEIKRKWENYE